MTVLQTPTESGGWWKGEIDDQVGHFPANYVSRLPDEKGKEEEAATATSPPVSPKPAPAVKKDEEEKSEESAADQSSSKPEEQEQKPAASVETPKSPTVRERVRAVYDYAGQTDTELSFTKGDVLILLERVEERGWWRGQLGEKVGHFPSSYVELLPEEVAETASENPVVAPIELNPAPEVSSSTSPAPSPRRTSTKTKESSKSKPDVEITEAQKIEKRSTAKHKSNGHEESSRKRAGSGKRSKRSTRREKKDKRHSSSSSKRRASSLYIQKPVFSPVESKFIELEGEVAGLKSDILKEVSSANEGLKQELTQERLKNEALQQRVDTLEADYQAQSDKVREQNELITALQGSFNELRNVVDNLAASTATSSQAPTSAPTPAPVLASVPAPLDTGVSDSLRALESSVDLLKRDHTEMLQQFSSLQSQVQSVETSVPTPRSVATTPRDFGYDDPFATEHPPTDIWGQLEQERRARRDLESVTRRLESELLLVKRQIEKLKRNKELENTEFGNMRGKLRSTGVDLTK